MKHLVFILLSFVAVGFAQRGRPINTPAPARPKPTPAPVIQGPLNLTFIISGRTIPTKDRNSKVDAFVKVFSKAAGKEETRLGTTDVVQDNDNPDWTNVFWVIWKRGQNQQLRLNIRDNDPLAPDDEVGEALINLDDYVTNGQDIRAILVGGGEIRVQAVKPFSFRLYGRNIPHLDTWGGKSDPYVTVAWRQGDGVEHVIGQTAYKTNEDNPDWPEVFEMSNYRKGADQWLIFNVYDHDGVKDDFVGKRAVDIDSYLAKRQTLIVNLNDASGKPIAKNPPKLGIVPA